VGLQFVVMTLIAERPPVRSPEAGSTFATPTVMHFGSVLLLSALLRWCFHVLMPLGAYVVLALSALAAPLHERDALFGVGAAALLLLFTGIHNAWDTVAYYVFVQKQRGPKRVRAAAGSHRPSSVRPG